MWMIAKAALSRVAGFFLPRRWLLIGIAVVGLPLAGYALVKLYDARINTAEERGAERVKQEIEAQSAKRAIKQRDQLRAAEARTAQELNTFKDGLTDELESVETGRDHNRYINRVLGELRQRQKHQ